MTDAAGAPLLAARDVSMVFGARTRWAFRGGNAPTRAVDGVSLDVTAGEAVGLVGESGSGKSTLARLLLRLLTPTSGVVLFRGQDVSGLEGRALRSYRGAVQAVFQDPFGSLNPRQRVGYAVGEPFQILGGATGATLRHRVRTSLERVGLPPDAAGRYPHEFSGGQRQRIAIARSLVNAPELVVLDEPVSSLDVSIRSQVLNLLADLRDQLRVAYLLITHDVAVAQFLCSRVAVMYRGRIVEMLPAPGLHREAQHPYTRLLLASLPPIDLGKVAKEAPADVAAPSGCRFRMRCPQAMPICTTVDPDLRDTAVGHRVACHLY